MNIQEAIKKTKNFKFEPNPEILDLKDSKKYTFFADNYTYVEFNYQTNYNRLEANSFDKNRFEIPDASHIYNEENLIAIIDYKAYNLEIPPNEPIKVKYINKITYDKSNQDKEVNESYAIFTLSYMGKERYFLDQKEYSEKDFNKFLEIHPKLQFINKLLLEDLSVKNQKSKNF